LTFLSLTVKRRVNCPLHELAPNTFATKLRQKTDT